MIKLIPRIKKFTKFSTIPIRKFPVALKLSFTPSHFSVKKEVTAPHASSQSPVNTLRMNRKIERSELIMPLTPCPTILPTKPITLETPFRK